MKKSTSVVKIRRIWVNENSSKDQVTVQFAQKLEAGSVGLSKLVQIAQGLTFEDSVVTCLISFSREQAQQFFGTTEANYSTQPFDQWPEPTTFEQAVGEALAISVRENTTQNPATPNQEPKINPQTNDILTKDDQPIYRHTELATVSTVVREFMAHDKVEATSESKAGAKVGATVI